MTITDTETPRLASAAERKVWQALAERLEPNDLLVPGQRVTDHLKDHEVDFVAAIEDAGGRAFTCDLVIEHLGLRSTKPESRWHERSARSSSGTTHGGGVQTA